MSSCPAKVASQRIYGVMRITFSTNDYRRGTYSTVAPLSKSRIRRKGKHTDIVMNGINVSKVIYAFNVLALPSQGRPEWIFGLEE